MSFTDILDLKGHDKKNMRLIFYRLYIKKDDFLYIANEVGVSRTTVRSLTGKIRNLIINDVESSTEKLGGFDINEQQK
jgi:hypothetical protein